MIANQPHGGRAPRPRLARAALSMLALLLAAAPAHAGDLVAARSLYAAASYEEALAALDGPPASDAVEQVQQLRALCLLALGRNDEAEKAIAQLVLHNPLYKLPPGEVAPKLESLFHEVRRETIPTAARSLYAQAKTSYDARKWSLARDQFSQLLTLLADTDASPQRASLGDLKQLGEGFLKLTESEIAADTRRLADEQAAVLAAEQKAAEQARAEAERLATERATAPAAAVGTAGTLPPGRPSAGRPAVPVYSAADVGVTKPVELRRVMPRWVPPTREMAAMSHSGLLEIIIDEAGSVAEARVAKPISPTYDQSLRDLARTWRYQPAMRDGQAVRYRMVLEVVLKPGE